ncbi:response regulator transcription factor [Sagittula salina]|uniref:Response regulator transcription factor n=1 Tax=Sagittula salina TaxID=2820268 RepID=A0A940MJ59_9RHOB|nr:response regulator transcription factor [Sagittula salina]MBP0482740.1 response regulator transcription factor [Sagittula salina]
MRSVLILEDNAETRLWMEEIVARVFPQATVATAALVADAKALARTQVFDLALVDLSLPDGEGLELIRLLSKDSPETQAVVTTIMGSDAAVVSALSAGAAGYLLKTEDAEAVARHLSQVAYGIPALSPAIARRIMKHFSYTGPVADAPEGLTQRETEALRLIAQGLRVSEVASEMGIAESTVSTYIKSIYRKLGISNRAEATFEATRLGLMGRE